jgi:tetratricopeptide (TPR) repeat protein
MQSEQTRSLSLADAQQLAQRHFANGELQACHYMCECILAAAPDHGLALHLMGLVAHRLGDLDGAVTHLRRALEAEPGNAMFAANSIEVMRVAGAVHEAIDLGEQAIARFPGNANLLSNLALCYYEQGDKERAKIFHERVLSLNAVHPASLNNLGSIARDEKDFDAALDLYRKVIELHPLELESHVNLASVLLDLERLDEARIELLAIQQKGPMPPDGFACQGRFHLARLELDQAELAFRNALALDSKSIDGRLGLSQVFLEKNLPDLAMAEAEIVLEIEPDNAAAHHQKALCLDNLLRHHDAAASLETALIQDPTASVSLMARGHMAMETGDMEAAIADFEKVRALEPEDVSALLALSRVRKIRESDDPLLLDLEAHLPAVEQMSPAKQIAFRFGLGDCYDGLGRHDEAWEQYSKGATLKRSSVSYDAAAYSNLIDEIIGTFTPDYLDALRGHALTSARPIFILGMPRSGTTLVESILASHECVHGAGELPYLGRLFASGTALGNSTAEELSRQMARYVSELAVLEPNAAHITDKMPSNFLYVGLIHALLPNATIIHTDRNAMDTCLSNFTRLFDRSQHHSYDLEELGHYYLDYQRLMQHWQAVLPDGAYHTINYQDMVSNPEFETRQLLQFCGLDWREDCLSFHKSRHRVRTASITQVREPIYKSSVEKWRRYETHLGELKDLIAP